MAPPRGITTGIQGFSFFRDRLSRTRAGDTGAHTALVSFLPDSPFGRRPRPAAIPTPPGQDPASEWVHSSSFTAMALEQGPVSPDAHEGRSVLRWPRKGAADGGRARAFWGFISEKPSCCPGEASRGARPRPPAMPHGIPPPPLAAEPVPGGDSAVQSPNKVAWDRLPTFYLLP